MFSAVHLYTAMEEEDYFLDKMEDAEERENTVVYTSLSWP